MTTHEHEVSDDHENLTAEEKAQGVRGGLAGAANLLLMMKGLQERIDSDESDVKTLQESIDAKKREFHELRRMVESQVDLELLADVVNQHDSPIGGHEAIRLALTAHAMKRGQKPLSIEKPIDDMRESLALAKKGVEIGVVSDRKYQFGTLLEDARVVIAPYSHVAEDPVRFRIVLQEEGDVRAKTGDIAPSHIVIGRDEMVERYLRDVSEKGEGCYSFEQGIKDERPEQLVRFLEIAASFIATGLADDERVREYHKVLLESALKLIHDMINVDLFGDHSSLQGLLEAYRAVDQEGFGELYETLIVKGLEDNFLTGAYVREYLTTMEKVTARMMNPEKDRLSRLDVARGRVAVLEAIEARRQPLAD